MKRLIIVICVLIAFLLPVAALAAPLLQYQGEINSPRPNAVLRGQVAINGTANHSDFWKYEVRAAPGLNANIPDAQWIRIAVQERSIVDGQLAVWDTTTVPDGVYSLRLRVVGRDGNYQDFDIRPVNVANRVEPTSTTPPTPLPTPTSELTPTVAPVETPTPLPESVTTPEPLATSEPRSSATAIVIDQPTIIAATPSFEGAAGGNVVTPVATAPVPSDSEGSVAPDVEELLGGSLDTGTLTGACITGAGITIGIFLLVAGLFLVKSLIRNLL